MQSEARGFEKVPAGHILQCVVFPFAKVPAEQGAIPVAPTPVILKFKTPFPVAMKPPGVAEHPVVEFTGRLAALDAYRPR